MKEKMPHVYHNRQQYRNAAAKLVAVLAGPTRWNLNTTILDFAYYGRAG